MSTESADKSTVPPQPQEQPATHQPDPAKFVFTRAERIAINRAVHLKGLIASEAWGYVVQISKTIVDLALGEIRAYNGTDSNHLAVLTQSWKTIEAHHQMLLNSIQAHIEEGDKIALEKIRAGLLKMPETETALAFPAVKPACDVK